MSRNTVIIVLAALVAAACGFGNSGSDNTATSASPEAAVPNVEVAVVEAMDVPQESIYSSTVQANATNNIMPQQGGRIRRINVEVGDYVSRGQVLAEMDRLQLDQLALQIRNDEVEYERLKSLYEQGGVSASDFEAAELAYQVRKSNYQNLEENTILKSPISGYVTARNFDAGDMFSMTAPIFTVQQVVPVKLLVGISESEFTRVKRGDSVTLTVDAIPGRAFTGRIERLYPTIDATTHTFKAEVVVSNTDRALRPGMYARVSVNFGTRHSMVVPDRAVVKQDGTGQRFVYLLGDDNVVSLVPVGTGRHIGAQYEITSGLEEGQTVVVKGQAALRDGVTVNVLEPAL